jgi:integrase
MAISPEMKFSDAASSWLDMRDAGTSRATYLKPRTIKTYKLELEALTLFFKDTRLCDMTIENIRKYQRLRSDGQPPFKHRRHPAHVNDEVAKLRKILTRANLWHLIADEYEELKAPFEQPRRVMTKKEEAHLFKVAVSRPEFAFIYAYCLLSVSTSASGAELRGLRLIDVDLIGRTLQINSESAKNSVRVRTIPLVDDAVWAANSLVVRARSLGSVEPHHFLFPYKRGNTPYNPNRQTADNGIQKRWNDLRNAAGLPWITGHVLRYQCITKLAEGGVDKITAKRIAGHITDKMWDKYSQVRFDSVREKLMGAFLPINPQPQASKEPAPSNGKKKRSESVARNPAVFPGCAPAPPQIVSTQASRQIGHSQSYTFGGGFYVTGNAW